MSFPAPAVVWQAVSSIKTAKLSTVIAMKLRMGRSFGQDMASSEPAAPRIGRDRDIIFGSNAGGRVERPGEAIS